MAQLIRPATKIKIVPKEGEIEITLNINITVDGKIVATADNVEAEQKEEAAVHFIPDFVSGLKLPTFGK